MVRAFVVGLLVLVAGCDGVAEDSPVPEGWVWDGGFDDWPAPDAGGDVDAGRSDAGDPGPDAGELDAGGVDAADAGPDAGELDAGGVDAGTLDAGPVDAGGSDAGGLDAGSMLDAGSSGDAGVMVDAGRPDAGPRADAGTSDAGRTDAGSSADAGRPDAGPPSARHTARVLHSTDAGNGFYEYLPPGYGDGELRPLLVFWHGLGENGDGDAGLQDLAQVLANGPPRLINQNRWSNALPFVVLSPQHRGGGCPGATEIRNFIAWSAANYQVDPRRLYLTGLSCGAIGSWSYLGSNLDAQVAAAVLVCGDPGAPDAGGSVWARNQCNLGRVAIWAFHGDADTTVRIFNAQDTMTRLIACPSPPRDDARFTVYPNVGHDSWSRTYDLSAGHDIYGWLLSQSK